MGKDSVKAKNGAAETSFADRRKHARHKVSGCSVSIGSHVGEILDISVGGLAFSYVDHGDWLHEQRGPGVLLGIDNLCPEEIEVKIISDCVIGGGVSVMRRCGVEFQKLSPKQLAQLEHFIMANGTMGMDPKYSG